MTGSLSPRPSKTSSGSPSNKHKSKMFKEFKESKKSNNKIQIIKVNLIENQSTTLTIKENMNSQKVTARAIGVKKSALSSHRPQEEAIEYRDHTTE